MAGGLLGESSLCLFVALLAGLVEASEAALVTAPERDDLLDAAGSFLAAVLLFRQPIISDNLLY